MPLDFTQISTQSLVSAITGQSLLGLAVGWARALPAAIIVPAFGMPGMRGTLRGAIALSLSGIALAVTGAPSEAPSVEGVVFAVLDGVLIAIPAALGIWIATMAGGLYDELTVVPSESGDTSLFGVRGATSTLFGFIAVIAFLGQGGPARLAETFCRPVEPRLTVWKTVTQSLTSGIGLSVTLAAPLVSAAILMEASSMLVVRQSPTLAAKNLLQVLRGFLRLLVLALFLQWLLLGVAAVSA